MNTMNRDYNVIQKKIRARVIKEYLNSIGQNKCVCFTCGNSSKYLIAEGLDVIEVLNTDHWWTYAEIQSHYKCFDATSGHLPLPLITEVANRMNKALANTIEHDEDIACGSGETFLCLKMAFPFIKINPVYNLDRATQFNEQAPLNDLVDALKAQPVIPPTVKAKTEKGIFATITGRESLGLVRVIVQAEGCAMVRYKGAAPFAVYNSELNIKK